MERDAAVVDMHHQMFIAKGRLLAASLEGESLAETIVRIGFNHPLSQEFTLAEARWRMFTALG